MKNEDQPQAPHYTFLKAQRCSARTRKGTPCQSPAVHGKNRCRMHGGAKGSGAQKGNQNAFKDGWHSTKAIAERRKLKEMIHALKETIEKAENNTS